MSDIHAGFSSSYRDAREKFLAAAESAGLPVQSHVHPLAGRDGEVLAMDVARDGPDDAECLLILSSACHGVEGYCGSGVQVFALNDSAWLAHARENAAGKTLAVLYIHALNPYGFSHLRRVTHENVDLNRNFHDFSQALPVNAGYRDIASMLLPTEWPPSSDNVARVEAHIAKIGLSGYQAAFTGGQHEFSDGLFFGGSAPTWSNLTLRRVLRQHGRKAAHIGWIDFHTGLGPSGHGERIFAGWEDAAAIARARRWWDGGGKTPITSTYDGSSSSAPLTGMMWCAARDECPQAEHTGIAMEYGTVPVRDVLQALRAEQWLNLHPEAQAEQARHIKQQFKDAFYTDTDAWREQIVRQGMESVRQAVAGLRAKP
ncbi:MAG: DUF2817 domain-containing protein [Betaproteobacteria bacterium]|nr:MAG: DUF2817 domain-containing protein [Betaproteobacteria bacterium]